MYRADMLFVPLTSEKYLTIKLIYDVHTKVIDIPVNALLLTKGEMVKYVTNIAKADEQRREDAERRS